MPGYRMGGSVFSTCHDDGDWTNSPPACIRVTCGPPPTIGQAQLMSTSTYYAGDTATYVCDAGFEIEGAASLLCDNDGSWAGTYPTCVDVECDAPPVVENAFTVGGEGTTSAGGSVLYVCTAGYALDGIHDGRVTCLRGGTWSTDLPRCSHVDCGPPPVPLFASVTMEGTTAGSTARVVCNPGYRLPEGGQVLEVVCDISGTWAGAEDAVCDPLDCQQPPEVVWRWWWWWWWWWCCCWWWWWWWW